MVTSLPVILEEGVQMLHTSLDSLIQVRCSLAASSDSGPAVSVEMDMQTSQTVRKHCKIETHFVIL